MRVDRLAPRCYFCPGPSREPITYVRWKGRRHYGFLCAAHRDEFGEHVAHETTVDDGMSRLRGIFAEEH